MAIFCWRYMLQEKRFLFVLVKKKKKKKDFWATRRLLGKVFLDGYQHSISWMTGREFMALLCDKEGCSQCQSTHCFIHGECLWLKICCLTLTKCWNKERKMCLWSNDGHWLYIFSVCHEKKQVASALFNIGLHGCAGEGCSWAFLYE